MAHAESSTGKLTAVEEAVVEARSRGGKAVALMVVVFDLRAVSCGVSKGGGL